jgi:hypothetical protein
MRWLVVAISLAITHVGCNDAPPPEGDRYARRFMPPLPEWRRESEIPSKITKKLPSMVIWELSQYAPGVKPTPEQRRAAMDLVERSHAAALANGWQDFDKATADGFVLLPDDGLHYMKEEFLRDDHVVDPERPEFLMYYSTGLGEKKLAGLMFYTREIEEWGLQIGGPLTVWHHHTWRPARCFRDRVIGVRFIRRNERCDEGMITGHRSPEMMHVWLIDHPAGPFATGMQVSSKLLPSLFENRLQERGY